MVSMAFLGSLHTQHAETYQKLLIEGGGCITGVEVLKSKMLRKDM